MKQNRRNFLKLMGYYGFIAGPIGSLVSCASLTNVGSTPADKELGDLAEGFSPYNGKNPNVQYEQRYTFFTKLKTRYQIGNVHPGVAWVLPGMPIVAAVDGEVADINRNIGGTNSGSSVIIKDMYETPYWISYAHVTNLEVKLFDRVKRGQTIAHSMGYFKMAVGKGFALPYNREDPDNYGLNHTYMDYWDGKYKHQYKQTKSGFEADKNQSKVINEICKSYIGDHQEAIKLVAKENALKHRNDYSMWSYNWSAIERFRLLNFLYTEDPSQFGLSDSFFNKLKQELYDNQPIVLTLPFAKEA